MTEDFRELAALYALGALDKPAAREFSAMLQDASPEVRQEVAEMQELSAMLSFSLPPVKVPHYLKDHLFSQISAISTSPSATAARKPEAIRATNVIPFTPAVRKAPATSRWLAMAAAAALVLSSGALFFQNRQLTQQRDQLAQQLERSKEQLQSTRQKLEEIVSPVSKVVALSGDTAPQASAKLIWDRRQQQWIIYIYDLPQLPADREYQLWYLTTDQSKISAAVFRPDGQGRSELRLSLPPAITSRLAAAAVSIEPTGGSPQPTGQIYLKGAI